MSWKYENGKVVWAIPERRVAVLCPRHGPVGIGFWRGRRILLIDDDCFFCELEAGKYGEAYGLRQEVL